MQADSLGARLSDFCRVSLPGTAAADVQDLARLSDGWESEIYFFSLPDASGCARDLVLRMYPGNPASAPDRKCEREYTAMRMLRDAGYPVPRVFAMERSASVLGSPFLIMERVKGVNFDTVFAQALPADRPRLAKLVIDLFAQLHGLDWRPFWKAFSVDGRQGGEPDTHRLIISELEEYRGYVERLDERGFDCLLDWLAGRLSSVSLATPSLVHLDFHTRNILMTPERRPYVIDWTGARVSDYRFDVAWGLIFVAPEMEQDFLALYRHVSGRDLADLEYFRSLAWSRRLLSIMISVRHGAEQLGMRPGAENAMRRNPRHMESVYRSLLGVTGIRLPDVEALLAELGRPA